MSPSVKILTSDVYEWMPGGFFVLHTCAGYLGYPFEKIGILCMIDHVSLPKHVRCEYN
jgi:hypothetical protein